MGNVYHVKPVAPAFGVEYRVDGLKTIVVARDGGASGWPLACIFIPVVLAGDRCEAVIGKAPKKPPYTLPELVGAALMLAPDKLVDTADQFNIPNGKWPQKGTFVLALLLYEQSKNIGSSLLQDYVHIDWLAARPHFAGFPEDYSEAVRVKVNECLLSSSTDALRSGLVRQAPIASSVPTIKTPIERNDNTLPTDTPVGARSITFALASCQYPSDILDRMPSDEEATPGPADASLLALGRLLDPAGGPSLLLLMGDQVYVDATAGMFDPKQLDDKYRIPYQRRGESRGVQYVEQRTGLQRHKLIDDHEIDDNWDPGSRCDPRRGLEAYWRFQRPGELAGKVWRDDVVHGGLPFFLGDSRTKREARTATDWGTMKIMGDVQFNALLSWLVKPDHAGLPKFVATPSAFLPRSLAVKHDPACALHADAWDGYPWSQHALLRHICDHQVKGLVFLSGDQHISNMVEACVSFRDGETTRQCTFYSIHSSALYAPYPFANAIPEDFARDESFRFPDPGTGPYSCRVRALFAPPGDGFALVKTMRTAAGGWEIQVVFHDATGPKKDLLPAVTLI